MAKRRDASNPSQLSLNLTSGPVTLGSKGTVIASGTISRQNNVAVFVDSATLAIRREAVERIARSGIFGVPQSYRNPVKR